MSVAYTPDPVQLVIDRLTAHGCNPKPSRPGQWNARCPVAAAHKRGDRNPSLSVGTGPDGKALLHCQTGCTTPDVARALDLRVGDLFPPRPHATIGEHGRIRATYPYHDADGTVVFEVVRYDPKTFKQRRPDNRGGWHWNLQGIDERPVYHLPQVRRAVELGGTVWIVEGEKDAENLQWEVPEGDAVTCNSGGAEKWRPENTRQVADARRIVIVRDNDAKGLAHARQVALALHAAGHGDIEVRTPPAGHKDVSEALGAGHGIGKLAVEWDSTMSPAWLTTEVAEATETALDGPTADDEDADDDWSQIDLVGLAQAFRAGTREPTLPTVLPVEGGAALFYTQRMNSLFGESGGGKTWVALAAVASVVRVGGRALFVDYEDHANGIVERLVLLGLTDDEIARVDYRNPTTSITRGLESLGGTT